MRSKVSFEIENSRFSQDKNIQVKYEPPREKTGFLPMRKQRRRSALR